MVSEARLRQELKQTLAETNFAELGEKRCGKVRDSYLQQGRRMLITTDRISAFDVVLGTIPFKGQVLNQLAAYWFEQTATVAPNHVLSVPDPNVMVVAECEQIPLEMVVRAYITGVTKTSLWTQYEQGVRNYCGNQLPEGLRRDQKLARPILTPTTKTEEHDRPLSRKEAIAEKLVDAATFDAAADICFKLFDFGSRHAAARGLVLVDTKYELGMLNGKITVTDEIHTPDSSRYWLADTYAALFEAGSEQRKIDKEFVRQWYAGRGYRGDGVPPTMPDEIRLEAARRYIQAYEVITGRTFQPPDEPAAERIARILKDEVRL